MKRRLLLATFGLALIGTAAAAEDEIVPRFDISSIRLQGNSLLPAAEVERLVAPFLGSRKDFGTLQEAIDAIEAAYKRRGYNLVTVILPEQELEKGVVTMQVIEPVVRGVKLEGNRYYSDESILRLLPTLKIGESPRLNRISENLRAVNENPVRKITLQFRNLERESDLQALLQVKDQKPWKVAINGDNSGSRQSGYYRSGITLQYANLWNRDHIATFNYTTSPDHADKVKIISGSYRIPLYSWGDTVDLFGGYSDVDNGKIGDVTSGGSGIIGGIRYNLTLPRVGPYEQKLIFGLDYRHYDNTIRLGETDYNSLAPDHLVHPFSIAYGGSWTDEDVALEGSLGVVHNEPWGGEGTADYFSRAFQAVRPGTVADYWAFRYSFNGMLYLPKDWMLRIFGSGQHTPDRLIPGEQFGLGGSSSVRGYEEREESWDGGFAGSAELYSPDLAQLIGIPGTQFRLVGFYDGGTGYNLRPIPGELKSSYLTSAGAGFRLGIKDWFSFSLDWGYALENSRNTVRGDNAVHFKGSVLF